MAVNTGVTLDKVIIEIESNATNATTGIEQLSRALNDLKASIRGGFNNLKKLADGLEKLNEASNKLSTTVQNLSHLNQITSSLNQLSNISKPTGLANAITNLEKLPSVFDKIDSGTLENVSRVSKTLADSLSPLAEKLGEIGQGYSAINQLADRYGVSTTKIREYTKQTTNHLSGLKTVLSSIIGVFKKTSSGAADFGKIAVRNFKSVHSKVKQVALSLLGTRTLFTAVRKAVSEYSQMDAELAWQTRNLWRALGAQLAPAIEYVMYLFKQFVRVIYSIVKALTGIDLIARANAKAMKNWGKSAKDTLGNLQKFDDLNVVDFGKGAGDNSLIELDEIDLSPIQRILELVRKIKNEMLEAFNTGQWGGVGEAIADLFNYGFSKIKTANIRKALSKFTKPIIDTLNGLFVNLNWNDFGSSVSHLYTSIILTIADILNNFNSTAVGAGILEGLLSFDISGVLDTWGYFFTVVNNIINNLVGILNEKWAFIKTEAAEVGKSFANIFNESVTGIDWGSATKALIEGVNTLIESIFSFLLTMDWAKLGDTIGTVVNTVFETFDFQKAMKSISKFASGLLTTLSTAIDKIEWKKIGNKIIVSLLDVDWVQVSIDLLTFLEELWGATLDAAAGVGAGIGELLIALFAGGTPPEDDARTFGEKIGDALTRGALEASKFRMTHGGVDSGVGVISFIKGLIKGWFGIHSPSTWARDELGENISLGFAQGLKNMWKHSKTHFVTFANGVIELINNMIKKINSKLTLSIGSKLSGILKALGVDVKNGTYQLFSIPTIPKLETGTNEIPYEGIYHLHPGEAVVPKKYNPALDNGGNDEMNEKLNTLIDIMNNMNFTNVVNIGNKTIYKEQQRYNKQQNDKYGTTVNI